MEEKAPYIVTLFVAALSWLTLHTSDRLSSIPFVEYRLSNTVNSGHHGVEVRLRNITVASKFDCFLLTLATKANETLKFGTVADDQQITLRGTVLSTLTVTKSKAEEWGIRAENLSPGADIAIFVPASGEGSPATLVEKCPATASADVDVSPKGSGDKASKHSPVAPPVLIERSPTTIFVEYELGILWSGLLVWFVAMMILLKKPTKPQREASASPKEVDLESSG